MWHVFVKILFGSVLLLLLLVLLLLLFYLVLFHYSVSVFGNKEYGRKMANFKHIFVSARWFYFSLIFVSIFLEYSWNIFTFPLSSCSLPLSLSTLHILFRFLFQAIFFLVNVLFYHTKWWWWCHKLQSTINFNYSNGVCVWIYTRKCAFIIFIYPIEFPQLLLHCMAIAWWLRVREKKMHEI